MNLPVKRMRVLKAAKKICGQPPRAITPAQFDQLMKILGMTYDGLHEHLRKLGYSRPRVPLNTEEIITKYYLKVQQIDNPKEITACQKELLAVLKTEYKKIGRSPPCWQAVVVRASKIRPKLPPWPFIVRGIKAVKRAEVAKVAKKICGQPPRRITTHQLAEVRQHFGVSRSAIYLHLKDLGYHQQSPDNVKQILADHCASAQKARTQAEVDRIKEELKKQVAQELTRISRPPIKWQTILSRIREMGLRWPKRPEAPEKLNDPLWYPDA